MSKPRKKQGNPDFRHRVTCPAPTNQQIESRLIELLSPGTFANLKDVKDKERSLRRRSPPLASRVLTLPVMAAIVLSLVYLSVLTVMRRPTTRTFHSVSPQFIPPLCNARNLS